MGTRRVSSFAVLAAGLLTAGLLTAGLLAGCGGTSGTGRTNALVPAPSGSVAASASAGTPEVAPSTAAPTGTQPVTVPSLPQRSFVQGSETLVGDLEDGVEPNCILLRTASNKIYQLVGGDRGKLTGATKHVTVYGHELSAMATTCQQGIPFLVTDVHP